MRVTTAPRIRGAARQQWHRPQETPLGSGGMLVLITYLCLTMYVGPGSFRDDQGLEKYEFENEQFLGGGMWHCCKRCKDSQFEVSPCASDADRVCESWNRMTSTTDMHRVTFPRWWAPFWFK